MSYVAHRKDFAIYTAAPDMQPEADTPKKAGLLQRLANALRRSRQRETDRVIGAYLARSGGRLTDSVEREMMWQLTGSSWGERR